MVSPREFWDDVRESFWAVPAALVACAVALALLLIDVDQTLRPGMLPDWPRLFGVGADGSREMLSAIAGSMITVAGVVFSITIVALSLASSQYSSRVLRNFIRDRLTQAVLGVFVGIFAYCLVVLRTIRGGDEGAFVPNLAVLVAIGLAFVGIAVLIFFIHHIGTSIQASHIVAAVAGETLAAIDRLFPEALTDPLEAIDSQPIAPPSGTATIVPASRSGFIQRVDLDAVLACASTAQVTVHVMHRVGDFLTEGAPLARVVGPAAGASDLARSINAACTVGRQRTLHEDAAFGIRQLVDVALKGLSPGINDVTTSIMCVDYLTVIIGRLGRRHIQAPLREAATGRVVGAGQSYEAFVIEAFAQVRQNAEGNVSMLHHLLRSFDTLSGITTAPARRRVLRRQVDALAEVITRTISSPLECAALEAIARHVGARLDADMSTTS